MPRENFFLLSGQNDLTEYRFNTGSARHTFCKHCGIKSFYFPRSHPDGVNVNARCLNQETVLDMQIVQVDGENWEEAYPDGQKRTYRFSNE